MYYYTCLICGKEFEDSEQGRRTCSKECSGLWTGQQKRERKDKWKFKKKEYFIAIWKGYYYLYDPIHPMSDKDGWIKRSRWLIAHRLVRSLEANEIVDHINGDKLDDRLENLRILSASDHGQIGFNPGRFKPGKRGPMPEQVIRSIRAAKKLNPWRPTPEQLNKMSQARKAFKKKIICRGCGITTEGGSPTAMFCSQNCGKRFRRQTKQV